MPDEEMKQQVRRPVVSLRPRAKHVKARNICLAVMPAGFDLRNWKKKNCLEYLTLQIEHHLFPTLPRCNLKTVSIMVKKFCVDNDLPYMVDDYRTGYSMILKQLEKIATVATKLAPTSWHYVNEKQHIPCHWLALANDYFSFLCTGSSLRLESNCDYSLNLTDDIPNFKCVFIYMTNSTHEDEKWNYICWKVARHLDIFLFTYFRARNMLQRMGS